MEYFICPMCEEKNEDHVKYCKTCGTWLQNETFPAKKLKKRKKGSRAFKVVSIVFGVLVGFPIVLAIIGAFSGEQSINTGSATQSINTDSAKVKQQANPGQSRSSPAAIGVSVAGTLSQWGLLNVTDKEKFEVTLKIDEVVRGAEAINLVKTANQFNKLPTEGYEYLMAKINVKLDKAYSTDAQLTISRTQFAAVSAAGKEYDSVFLTMKEGIDGKLYAGAEHTGWAVFQVEQGDNPLIAVARDAQGRGGIWFSTK